MQKTYISPSIYAVPLMGSKALLQNSIIIDKTNQVDDQDDIGFVKEEHRSLWDDDWND